jgi:FMN phosphatase YigB (HAD superfamily)
LIKGIIFDLGSTLMRFTGGSWETVERTGAEAMAAWYFKKKHIKLDGAALVEAFLAECSAGWETTRQTQIEVTAQQSLRHALKKIDAPASAEALVEAALKVYFAFIETAWQSYPDAVDTLRLLRGHGYRGYRGDSGHYRGDRDYYRGDRDYYRGDRDYYRLGLYSNAYDDAFIQRMVNRLGLRPWLSPTFSSAGWGWCKPRREPFDLIASRWGLPPQEIVVVGDTLNADVLGAQNAGMHSILVTMDENPSNADHRHIQPTAVAGSLSELPELVAQL